MTDRVEDELRALLREAIAFGMDIRHKKNCNWANPPSNFHKGLPCACGRDALRSRIHKEAFGR